MSRKEMGLAVRALGQYADDCLCGTGDYIEMVSAGIDVECKNGKYLVLR